MAAYNPGFEIGKNFKTLNSDLSVPLSSYDGFQGALDYDTTAGLLSANPNLAGGYSLNDLFTYGKKAIGGNAEMGFQYGDGWSTTNKFTDWANDNLSGFSLQRRGASGLKDGRTNAIYDPQGNLVYAGARYSYDPAGDTLKSLFEAAALAAAGFGGLGLAGAGPWSGLADMFGGAAAGGAAEAGAATLGAEAAIPTAAELGALEGGSLLAGGAGIGGTIPAGMASFAVPAEIGLAGTGLMGTLPEFGMAGVDATQALTGGPMGLNGLGQSSAASAMSGSAGAGGLSSYVDKLLSPQGLKSTIPALTQMYSGINQRNQAKKLAGQISGLGKAGGPYELALRKQLERRDAASGRRSQYGPREVELQAKLAELMSRNGGTLAQLMQQQMGGTNQLLQGGLIGGKKLLDLFGG